MKTQSTGKLRAHGLVEPKMQIMRRGVVDDDEDHAGHGDGGKVEQVNCTLVEAEDRCEKKTKRSGLFGRKSARQSFLGVDMDKLRSSH